MEPNQTYHIYNRANGSENLFKEAENYRYFLKQYAKYIHPVAETYAYCLLPNHFLFLLRIREKEEIVKMHKFENFNRKSTFPKFETLEKFVSKQFSNLFSSYTQAYNKVYGRQGSLFQKNFKRKLVENDNQFQETFLYINLNPVKHGCLVSHENSWPWSSWKSYLNINEKSLLNRKEAVAYFDDSENLKYCIDKKKEVILNMNMG